jgi:threonine dehydratase
LINCGGGGLTAGSAIALKSRLPDVDVYTVEPEEFDDTARSLASGKRVAIRDEARSICDALLTDMPGQLTFDIMSEHVTRGLTVSDAEVREAMRFAFRHLKIVVEPGGATGLAAILAGKVETAGKTTAIIFSGGNVDAELFASIQTELT